MNSLQEGCCLAQNINSDTVNTVPEDTSIPTDGEIAGGILIHVGGGVQVVAVLVGDASTHTKDASFILHRVQAQGVVDDPEAAVQHERVQAMAEQWIGLHARRVVDDTSSFAAGDVIVSRSSIGTKDMMVRWMIRNGEVFLLTSPVLVNPTAAEYADVEIVPAVAPGGSGDSADLAMFCGTVAASFGLDVQMAITGDLTATGKVLTVGSLAEKMRTVIEFNIPHMLIPAAHGHPPGRRSGVQLWCARQAHDGVCSMLDAVSLDPPQIFDEPTTSTNDSWLWVVMALAFFISWLL